MPKPTKGPDRRIHKGVFKLLENKSDHRWAKQTKHGDKGGETLVFEKFATDARYGNFRGNSGRHKIGTDGKLKFSWAGQEAELFFKRQKDKGHWGSTVNLYRCDKGLVIVEEKTFKVLWFVPNKKLPTPKT